MGHCLVALGALTVTAAFATGLAAAADAVRLPVAREAGRVALEHALAQRRSVRAFAELPLTQEHLAQLLWAAQGRTGAQGQRTTPSAGARYPLRLWVVAGTVEGLEPGVWGVAEDARSLLPPPAGRLRVDPRGVVGDAASGQTWLRQAPAIIVIAADPRATRERYGDRADRYIAIEAGAAAQNLLLQAQVLGLGGTIVGAFDEVRLREVLALTPGQQILVLVPVGHARRSDGRRPN